MRWQETVQIASIPMRHVGPVKIISNQVTDIVPLPLATFESPLWPSTHRGARLCTQAGGIYATLLGDGMTRSVVLEAPSTQVAYEAYLALVKRRAELETMVRETSRFAELIDIQAEFLGSLLYLRFVYQTGDAAGHNMVTLASDRLMAWIQQQYPLLRYVSISGNYCADKKVSAVNGILGRGKKVIAEVTISAKLCQRYLKTTPEKIVDLHVKKNLLGSILAGSLRTANAHFANMLLAFYLATGQDAANIIEGSQGMVHAEVRDTALYFSVTLPNIIVGTVGNGKSFDFVQHNLRILGCLEPREPGHNAQRLAIIAAAAVLCGELSLLAAQTNDGELMRSHLQWER